MTQQVDKIAGENYLHRVTNSVNQIIVGHNVSRNRAKSVAADLGKTWMTSLVIVLICQLSTNVKISAKSQLRQSLKRGLERCLVIQAPSEIKTTYITNRDIANSIFH